MSDWAFHQDRLGFAVRAGGRVVGTFGRKADAVMAAAAPELLKVASDLTRQVEEFEEWDEFDWPAAKTALQRLAESARAAIAKAKAGAP